MVYTVIQSYQLNAPEATNSQRVDDVEVVELQTGEEGVLCFVSGDKRN